MASGSSHSYSKSPSLRVTRSLWASVPSMSSVPRYSTRWPFARQSTSGPSISASCGDALGFVGGDAERVAPALERVRCAIRRGRRTRRRSSSPATCPRRARVPDRVWTVTKAISTVKSPSPKRALLVMRSDWMACSLIDPAMRLDVARDDLVDGHRVRRRGEEARSRRECDGEKALHVEPPLGSA